MQVGWAVTAKDTVSIERRLRTGCTRGTLEWKEGHSGHQRYNASARGIPVNIGVGRDWQFRHPTPTTPLDVSYYHRCPRLW